MADAVQVAKAERRRAYRQAKPRGASPGYRAEEGARIDHELRIDTVDLARDGRPQALHRHGQVRVLHQLARGVRRRGQRGARDCNDG